MYVIAYTLIGGKPTYRLHALDLSTLNDKSGSPITISASHSLTNGSVFAFNPSDQRQRPALLQANGNLYAGFGSFCDWGKDQSRGWLLGWNQQTLAPLPADDLNNQTPPSSAQFFLSSVWMSGYGVATDNQGNLFVVTGNSDNPYTGNTNIQESAVKFRADLSAIEDLFTPTNQPSLDHNDNDYGSGGLLVVPDQPGKIPHLAVAAGKDGHMFILNRDSMGGFHNPDDPKYVDIGACWCGQSYYKGSDGVGRVVSSGGDQANSWKINTSLSPALQHEATSPSLAPTDHDGGFFTSVSSNGLSPNSAIIWAVGRSTGSDHHVTLYAFNGTSSGAVLNMLWSGNAGTWPEPEANSNIVPTVANGRVYVASYRELEIFGLRPLKRPGMPLRREMVSAAPEPPPLPPGAWFWGTIKSVDGSNIKIELRTGEEQQIDLSEAVKNGTTVDPVVGKRVVVSGKLNAYGIFEASSMARAKGPGAWGPDKRE